jgi:ABC-2 type transport system permease protein
VVLSNLVEEKNEQDHRIWPAAVPIDAIFTASCLRAGDGDDRRTCWAGLAVIAIVLANVEFPQIPTPATGWPLFLGLGVAYFRYLPDQLFLNISAMASTVRGANLVDTHHGSAAVLPRIVLGHAAG